MSQLARQAIHQLKVSRNRPAALRLARQAVAEDPDDPQAWKALGMASGWTSHEEHGQEMLKAFETAIRLTPQPARTTLAKECAVEVANIVDFRAHVYLQVLNGIDDPGSDNSSAFIDTFAVAGESMIRSLEASYEWAGMRETLDKIMALAAIMIRGFEFHQPRQREATTFRLQSELEDDLKAVVTRTADEIRRKFDPAYTTPRPEEQKPAKQGGCFVVTATMGSDSAYPVKVLREFRDLVLTDHVGGRNFIDWYRKRGPGIASVIADSRALRIAAFAVIVAPATVVARIWLYLRRRT